MARKLLFFGILVLGLLFDQITKFLAMRLTAPMQIVPSFLSLSYVQNKGAAFGILQNKTWLFLTFACLVFFAVYYYRKEIAKHQLLTIGAALILSGTLGNTLDRLIHGFVIDFIAFSFWPVFNGADSMLTIGSCLIIWWSFFDKESKS